MPDTPAAIEHDLFLGGLLDPVTRERTGAPLTYDPDDLVTHGVIVGMTGSGKTGLGIVLLEELLLRGVPCLLIDPKGDLTNLVLTFPELAPAEFEPWIDQREAETAGRSVTDQAVETAAGWRRGLADWGIDPARVRRLKEAADVTIYTPGSSSGVPLNLIGSLRAPAGTVDAEARQDEVLGFVSGLLGMAGIDTDPLTSPEHILCTNLIEHAWSQGRDLDLTGLLAMIADPPLRKLGVLDIDTFVPPKVRMALLVRLNGLLASPSFQAWAQGPPADIESLLFGPTGRPRAAVVTLSHLSDEERQFVVTLLLSKLIGWMRAQPGTSSLRVLAYMDEVFGFVPPNGAPPAKKPILTLLKQARAFGVGLVLATQNPVDVDYKALSNAGTWMIGRLQTERDKARLLEGMTSASGSMDVGHLDATLSGLDKRQFVLHAASTDEPRLFTTRWAMSYLRGPLTREQIARVTAARPPEADLPATVDPPTTTDRSTTADRPTTADRATTTSETPAGSGGVADTRPNTLRDDESLLPPTLPDGVRAYHLDPAAPWASSIGATVGAPSLEAALVARVQLLFDDARAGVDHRDTWEAIVHPLGESVDWASCRQVDYDDRDLRDTAPTGAVYRLPRAPVGKAAFFRDARKALVAHLRAGQRLNLLRNEPLALVQRPGETDDEFGRRCEASAEQRQDEEAAVLRDTWARRSDKVRTAIERAEQRVSDLTEAERRRQSGALVTAAGSLLSSFLGGRRSAKRLARDVGSAAGGLSGRSSASLRTAERARDDKRDDLAELEAELAGQLQELDVRWDAAALRIDTVSIPLEAADITVAQLALVWVPMR